jgi:hypothetical protein
MQMIDDDELLRRYAVERSEASFTELVERHVSLVYSTALRQVGGDAHLAEDVRQLVFLDLARKAAQLTRHTSLTGGWRPVRGGDNPTHHSPATSTRTAASGDESIQQ